MILNYNGETLAYLGDSLYELEIRKYLIGLNIGDVNKLHKMAIKFTSGDSQATIITKMLENNVLTEDEILNYKHGRNSNHSKNGRNISVVRYKMATGFEALIGYLYLSNQIERMNYLINLGISYLKEE